MATVNKNFRIKNGLVVEGTTATINGNNILSENVSDSYIINLIGGTTLIKSVDETNLSVNNDGQLSLNDEIHIRKSEYWNGGSQYGIITNNGDQFKIVSINGDIVLDSHTGVIDTSNAEIHARKLELDGGVLADNSGNFKIVSLNGDLTLDSHSGVINATGSELHTDKIEITNAGIIANNSDNLKIVSTYGDIVLDSHSGTLNVQANRINTNDAELQIRKTEYWNSGNQYGVITNNGDAFKQVATTGNFDIEANNGDVNIYGQNDINLSTNNGNIILNPDGTSYLGSANPGNQIVSRGVLDGLIGDNTVDGSTGNTVKDRIDSAVAGLVNNAPELLNTLKELADAIADNPNYASDVANLVSGKQDTLTAGDGIDLTGSTISAKLHTGGGLEIKPGAGAIRIDRATVDTWYDGAGRGAAAEQVATAYADSLISTEVTNRNSAIATAKSEAISTSESYTDSAISNGNSNAEPTYKGVKLGYYTELVSGWSSVSNGNTFSPLSWNTNTWGTAKLTVHVRSGIHSQASEILVARDSSNNLHITEYAIVTTNGQLADISVTIDGNDTKLTVSPTTGHNETEAVASGSVVVWAD